jgi:hypothetical protein
MVIALKISGDVALLFPSNSSGQHDVDQFHPALMFGFQFNPKDAGVKQPRSRKMQRAASNHTTAREQPHNMPLRASTIWLTEVSQN